MRTISPSNTLKIIGAALSYHVCRPCTAKRCEPKNQTVEATTVLKTWNPSILMKHESSLPPKV